MTTTAPTTLQSFWSESWNSTNEKLKACAKNDDDENNHVQTTEMISAWYWCWAVMDAGIAEHMKFSISWEDDMSVVEIMSALDCAYNYEGDVSVEEAIAYFNKAIALMIYCGFIDDNIDKECS
jgi:hypothetical protein